METQSIMVYRIYALTSSQNEEIQICRIGISKR